MSNNKPFHPYELLDENQVYNIKKEVQKAIDQFNNPFHNEWVKKNFQNHSEINQGTILKDVPMYFFDDNFEMKVKKTHAIILSNSCDATRRQNIILAPLFPFAESEQDKGTIEEFKKNKKFSVLYFPDTLLKDYYINLDYIYNLNLDLLNNLIQQRKVQKLFDLTNSGYYLLITKLTIFFSRPESTDIQRKNNIN